MDDFTFETKMYKLFEEPIITRDFPCEVQYDFLTHIMSRLKIYNKEIMTYDFPYYVPYHSLTHIKSRLSHWIQVKWCIHWTFLQTFFPHVNAGDLQMSI